MALDDQNNSNFSQYDPFGSVCSSNLVQEEPDFPLLYQPEPFYPIHPPNVTGSTSDQDSANAKEQKHRHKLEWMQAIRTSLFPILFSMIVVFILLRILFMIHDAEHLLTFLQTILGLFGASASGYAYAQTRSPGEGRNADSIPIQTDSACFTTESQPMTDSQEK